jgi:hypothetical protein
VHSVRLRLTVCLSTVAATAVLGAVLAPAASANPVASSSMPGNAASSSGQSPSILTGVPPFGRKL